MRTLRLLGIVALTAVSDSATILSNRLTKAELHAIRQDIESKRTTALNQTDIADWAKALFQRTKES